MSAASVEALDALLRARRSVRGFKPGQIPDAELRRIFAMAQLAPSNCNVQPWVVHVVSGAARDRLSAALAIAARAGERSPDFPLTGGYPGEYRTRQIDAAKALFTATGVARDDAAAREASFMRNFAFFDAPHAAFIFMPDWAGIREATDCGMYAQSLMLALTAHGYASCAQGALGWHAPVVKRELGVADDMRLLFGISFGPPDEAHPANAARTSRAEVDAAVVFHTD